MNLQKVGNIARKLLTTALVFSCMGTTCLAAEQTTITYVGQGVEEYEVTVPASLTPGSSADINLSGTWAADRAVIVSAPETVTLTCDMDGSEQVLDVEFENIYQEGDNYSALQQAKTLRVSEMPSNILFGTWTGTITYEVEIVDAEIETCDHSYAYGLCVDCGEKETAGLYDVDGNLLATWEELNIDVTQPYSPMYQMNTYYGNFETHPSNVLPNYPNGVRLVVSHDIDSISGYAFADCGNYTIVVPSTVTTIGANAFANSEHYQYNGPAVITME